MKWLYRITLILAGCYFESAIRNVVQMSLYWIGKPNLVQGFLPYIVPVFLGYVYAVEVREHWSESRVKNDIMAYMGSTVLIGYPLLISITLWLAGLNVESPIALVRTIATIVLLVNLAIAALVWRKPVVDGLPISLPWGTEANTRASDDAEGEDEGEGGDEAAAEDEAATEGEAQFEGGTEVGDEARVEDEGGSQFAGIGESDAAGTEVLPDCPQE